MPLFAPLASCLTRLGAPGRRRVAAPSSMFAVRGCGQVPDLVTTAHRRGGPPNSAVARAAWDAMPHRVSQGQAQEFLAGKYGAVEELRPLGGGFWSSGEFSRRSVLVSIGGARRWLWGPNCAARAPETRREEVTRKRHLATGDGELRLERLLEAIL